MSHGQHGFNQDIMRTGRSTFPASEMAVQISKLLPVEIQQGGLIPGKAIARKTLWPGWFYL